MFLKRKLSKDDAICQKTSVFTFPLLLNFLWGANQALVSAHEFRGKPQAFKCAFNCVGSGSVVK